MSSPGPARRLLNFVFTVTAGEASPVWPGQQVTAHWSINDPAAVEGDDGEKRKAFLRAYTDLHRRIALFVVLPVHKLKDLARYDVSVT